MSTISFVRLYEDTHRPLSSFLSRSTLSIHYLLSFLSQQHLPSGTTTLQRLPLLTPSIFGHYKCAVHTIIGRPQRLLNQQSSLRAAQTTASLITWNSGSNQAYSSTAHNVSSSYQLSTTSTAYKTSKPHLRNPIFETPSSRSHLPSLTASCPSSSRTAASS